MENVGAPTFSIFPQQFRSFFKARRPPARPGPLTLLKNRTQAGVPHQSLVTKHRSLFPPHACYITVVLRGYCVGTCQNGTYQNPGYLREPAEPGGYVAPY